jgi:hypothetical protein
MTVWTWRAVVGDDVLAGIRADHVGDAGELADQIGTEVRCALGRDAPAVAVTVAKVHGDERDAGGTGGPRRVRDQSNASGRTRHIAKEQL